MMWRFKKRNFSKSDIDPDEVFLDSQNIPQYDNSQFEGRIERPINKRNLIILGIVFVILIFSYSIKVFNLQITQGAEYREQSEQHRLRFGLIFADRGNIYDRDGIPLAWNEPSLDGEFDQRKYIEENGYSNLLGYVRYPQKDSSGFYYEVDFEGVDGIERAYDDFIKGQNGLKIIEINAKNNITSQSTVKNPDSGKSIITTIDSDMQRELFNSIKAIADDVGFSGGGGVIMNIQTGEILALVTYPEYDSNILTEATSTEAISQFQDNNKNPFLHRVINGLYTPGSIIKPFIAIGALEEKIIAPETNLISRGQIEIPNPYNPNNPSIFTDWKAHGSVDMQKALAISSNVYFYIVGGGFKDQKGLGIENIEKYVNMFGFGQEIKGEMFSGIKGTVPNPKWKEENFNGDPWRLGDTYFTSIGQYGFQVTPLQVVRAIGAIANGGKLIQPVLVKEDEPQVIRRIDVGDQTLQIVREGMRKVVLEGTGKGLDIPGFEIGAKTGTAELGISKEKVNSWATGFYPYDNPKYAFAVVMEKGSRTNLIGGIAVSRRFFDWMIRNKPEALK